MELVIVELWGMKLAVVEENVLEFVIRSLIVVSVERVAEGVVVEDGWERVCIVIPGRVAGGSASEGGVVESEVVGVGDARAMCGCKFSERCLVEACIGGVHLEETCAEGVCVGKRDDKHVWGGRVEECVGEEGCGDGRSGEEGFEYIPPVNISGGSTMFEE